MTGYECASSLREQLVFVSLDTIEDQTLAEFD